MASGPPEATQRHLTHHGPVHSSLSPRPAQADSAARRGVSLAARRSPALGRPPFPRWPRRARLLRRARGGGGVESLPHPLAPGLPHQAAADDPPRSCGARCTDERRRCRAGTPSCPRRHPCSRHGGAAATAAATAGTRARAGVLPGGEAGACVGRVCLQESGI